MAEDYLEQATDLGNARRFVRLHGADLRYVHTFGRWFWWDGCRWREDESGEIIRRATDVSTDLYQQAAGADSEANRKELARHAISTESEKRLRSLVSLAQSLPSIPAGPDEFDADPWVLNTPKGLVDLRTGELSPHDRAAMCSKVTGAGYEPQARSELWERCLETWLPDPEVRAFVQRAVGYSLIGIITEQILLIMWGGGANGKSVLQEILRKAIGDYAMHTPPETLISNHSGGIPNDIARLRGARLVSASESDENRRLAEGRIKALTSGDAIAARFMRAEWFEFVPTFTVWLSTNHKPIIRGQDLGIWRRIKLVPFEVEIPEADRDPYLLQKLETELPAVLAWAIQGCLDYQAIGLNAPEAVEVATADYRRESDVFGEFIEERCEIKAERFATSEGLYLAYQEWAKGAGEKVLTKTMFGKKLNERGFDREKQGGVRGWIGIALR